MVNTEANGSPELINTFYNTRVTNAMTAVDSE